MNALNPDNPHIRMERAHTGAFVTIWFDLGDGKREAAIVRRTAENAQTLDYFCDRLQIGVNV